MRKLRLISRPQSERRRTRTSGLRTSCPEASVRRRLAATCSTGAAARRPSQAQTYCAGCAYGLLEVTHPPMYWVSYWYQSTCSVTGITGTSESITCSSWSTTWCWTAELVVAAYSSIRASVDLLEYRSKLLAAAVPIGAVFGEYSNWRSS